MTGWINEFICQSSGDVTDTNGTLKGKSCDLLEDMLAIYRAKKTTDQSMVIGVPKISGFGTHDDDLTLQKRFRKKKVGVYNLNNGIKVY